MGNLAGWPYWKVISITGQSGAGTDYQAKLTIGDSAGGDFHLEGHCTNFPQDIRITDDDGTTLLDHFVEDLTADPIIVQVKVDDDLGSNRDVRVYYGKSGETSVSNISNTMIFGDDFDTDKSKWTGDTADLTITGSTGIFNAGGTTVSLIKATTSVTLPFIIESSMKRPVNAENRVSEFGAIIDRTTDNMVLYYDWGINNNMRFEKDDGGRQDIVTNMSVNVVQKQKIVAESSSSVRWYFDDVEGTGSPYTNSTHIVTAALPIAFMTYGAADFELYWVFARKFNSPEPAFSSAGAEQTPPTGASPTSVFYGPLVGPLGGPI